MNNSVQVKDLRHGKTFWTIGRDADFHSIPMQVTILSRPFLWEGMFRAVRLRFWSEKSYHQGEDWQFLSSLGVEEYSGAPQYPLRKTRRAIEQMIEYEDALREEKRRKNEREAEREAERVRVNLRKMLEAADPEETEALSQELDTTLGESIGDMSLSEFSPDYGDYDEEDHDAARKREYEQLKAGEYEVYLHQLWQHGSFLMTTKDGREFIGYRTSRQANSIRLDCEITHGKEIPFENGKFSGLFLGKHKGVWYKTSEFNSWRNFGYTKFDPSVWTPFDSELSSLLNGKVRCTANDLSHEYGKQIGID